MRWWTRVVSAGIVCRVDVRRGVEALKRVCSLGGGMWLLLKVLLRARYGSIEGRQGMGAGAASLDEIGE